MKRNWKCRVSLFAEGIKKAGNLVKWNTSFVLFFLSIIIVFASCNGSLSVLKRRYRPGYSITISSKENHTLKSFKEEKPLVTEQGKDTLTIQNTNEMELVSSTTNDLYLKEYTAPGYVMPCDTPPQKTDSAPFSLYHPAEPREGKGSKWKPLEPYNWIGFIVFVSGIIMGVLGGPMGPFFFFFLLFNVYILDIISIVKIKKHPKKYSSFSKIFDWIFVPIISLILLITIILLLFILLAG